MGIESFSVTSIALAPNNQRIDADIAYDLTGFNGRLDLTLQVREFNGSSFSWRPVDTVSIPNPGNDPATASVSFDFDVPLGTYDFRIVATSINPDGTRVTDTAFANGGQPLLDDVTVCFLSGTRILTAAGEVPVEQLRAGDLVVSPGRGAPLKPVRWVGRTRVDLARHRDRRKVAPILIRTGALGAGVPARDLRVSPEHGLLLAGRLVPARLLVNGTTIIQETWHGAIAYWHVELDEHGALVADGALAESYFDDGNRYLFDNRVTALHVDFGAGRYGGRYATEAFAPPILTGEDPDLARIVAALPVPEAAAKQA